MRDTDTLLFEPFRLDLGEERLWQGEEVLHLTHKAFAVLRSLVEHPGQLVTKDELFDVVWAGTFVSEAAMTACIREIRRTLGDRAQTPQFIETVRGRGYRFLAPVTVMTQNSPPASPRLHPPPALRPPELLVGREAELARLHQWFASALQGKRQVGFIAGEVGIGKTTLVDAFVAQVAAADAVWISRGQCIEQYGAGEAYLPLLEALGRLGRGAEDASLIKMLRQHAPSWLVQLPALLPAAEHEALQRQGGGATQARMLRELAEALEILTADRPLVLVLEDLHWCDYATLEWLAFVARRREAARLLVLGTYRPVEAIVHDHPLRMVTQELQRQGQCVELALDYLSEASVAAYVATRCGTQRLPKGLAAVLHQRTNGNPLFLSNVMDTLLRHGILQEDTTGWRLAGGLEAVAAVVPESLRQLIEQQLGQIDPDTQTVLEAASVAGMTFSAAAVAAGVAQAEEDVEVCCAALVRRQQFVHAQGTTLWPDGTVAAQYGLRHALYQEVLYDRVPVGRRARLHRQIGERLEAAYGDSAGDLAAELAVHFEQGRDGQRAIQYLRQAGENALRRSAHHEAIDHATRGLALLKTLQDTPERTQQELALHIALGAPLIVTKGYGSPEAGKAYSRARELCQQVGDTPQVFPVLWGLWRFYTTRGVMQTARELGEQLLTLAQRQDDPALLLAAHQALGTALCFAGALAPARTHLEQGMALSDPQQQRALAVRYGVAPGVECLAYAAGALWSLGYPDQALRRSHEARALAQELAHPPSLAMALHWVARLHLLRREAHMTHTQAEATVSLSTEQGFAQWMGMGTFLRGWALTAQGQAEEGMAQMRQGMTETLATGLDLARPLYLALLAEAYGKVGQVAEGLRLLAEAQMAVDEGGQRYYETELYRLKGELLLKPSTPNIQEAEACFHQALDIASRQQAKSYELRAAMSLSRLWQQQGNREEGRELLAPIYGWFTEGFDTADLQEAKLLLEELI